MGSTFDSPQRSNIVFILADDLGLLKLWLRS